MNTWRTPQRWRCRRRSAVALITVLICLFVISALAATLLQVMLAAHRQTRRQQQQHQSLWLAQSALSRAQARLLIDDEYRGETWRVTAAQLHASQGGVAVIQVRTIESDPRGRRLLVEARFPDDPMYGIRTTKEVLLTISTPQAENRP